MRALQLRIRASMLHNSGRYDHTRVSSFFYKTPIVVQTSSASLLGHSATKLVSQFPDLALLDQGEIPVDLLSTPGYKSDIQRHQMILSLIRSNEIKIPAPAMMHVEYTIP